MKLLRNLALTTRLSLAILMTGWLPAPVIGCLAIRTAQIAHQVTRNLFECSGDIQVFATPE
jgi:hypothetical protein